MLTRRIALAGLALAAIGSAAAATETAATRSAPASASEFRGLRNIALLVDEPAGFRQFEAKSGQAFAAGQTAYLYAEPANFGFSTKRGRPLRVLMELTIEIRDRADLVVFVDSAPRFLGKFVDLGVERTYVAHQLTFPQLPVGDFTMLLAFRDVSTGGEFRAQLPVVIDGSSPSAGVDTPPSRG